MRSVVLLLAVKVVNYYWNIQPYKCIMDFVLFIFVVMFIFPVYLVAALALPFYNWLFTKGRYL